MKYITPLLMAFCSNLALACGEHQDWHLIPQITDLRINKQGQLGLHPEPNQIYGSYNDGRYFVLDDTPALRPIGQTEFEARFPQPTSTTIAQEQRRDDSLDFTRPWQIFNLADEHTYEVQSAYCAEGETLHHTIRYNGAALDLPQIDRCDQPNQIIHVGDYTLFSVIHPSECNSWGGSIEVYDRRDWRHVKSIDSVPGKYANQMLYDSPRGEIWVAGRQGLLRLNQDFTLKQRWFYHEAFSEQTIQILLTPDELPIDPFAVLARLLDVQDMPAYHQAIDNMPESIRASFELYPLFMFSSGPPSYPKEWQPLLPFFIAASESANEQARAFSYWRLCEFDDPQARAHIRQQLPAIQQAFPRRWQYMIKKCDTEHQ